MTDLKLEGLPEEDHPTVDDFAMLFINDIPLLDVRAPVEFNQGAFPNAINIPLMDDAQREAVGTEYKQQGQDAAILLGAELITEEEQTERKQRWTEFFSKTCLLNRNLGNEETSQHRSNKLDESKWGGVLYCFRGGLRSKISQQWIFDHSGIKQPRVDGGYKAMRRFLIDTIERLSHEMSIVVLGGRTGSGKTRLLKQLDNSIDLEGLANHRGSAFGPTATPQPTQINFENSLAIELLKKEAAGHKVIVVEDEGRNIGSVGLPASLFTVMQQSPLVMLEVSETDRNKVSIDEYIIDTQQSFNDVYGTEKGEIELSNHLLNSLGKIKKRLGGVRYQEAHEQMLSAIELRRETGSIKGFIPLVSSLLVDYYDPMYDYQSRNKHERVVFKGAYKEVVEYLSNSKTA